MCPVRTIPSVGIVVWFGLHSGRWREVARLVGSLGVVVGTLWVLFLASATRANFYVGFDSLWQSARNLALLSVRTNFEQAGLWGTDAAGVALAALATGLVARLGIQVLYEGWHERRAALGIVVGVALGSMVVARWGAGVLYPTDRTGLWLVVLFLLAWGCGADRERSAGARYVHMGVMALLVAQFVSQWQGRYFIVWAYDEDTKAIARQIAAERGGRPTRVSASASRQPALEFYRVTLPIAGMAPVERVEKPVLEGYDYYVLGHEDLGRGEVGRMRVVRVDRVKGSLFARGE